MKIVASITSVVEWGKLATARPKIGNPNEGAAMKESPWTSGNGRESAARRRGLVARRVVGEFVQYQRGAQDQGQLQSQDRVAPAVGKRVQLNDADRQRGETDMQTEQRQSVTTDQDPVVSGSRAPWRDRVKTTTPSTTK